MLLIAIDDILAQVQADKRLQANLLKDLKPPPISHPTPTPTQPFLPAKARQRAPHNGIDKAKPKKYAPQDEHNGKAVSNGNVQCKRRVIKPNTHPGEASTKSKH